MRTIFKGTILLAAIGFTLQFPMAQIQLLNDEFTNDSTLANWQNIIDVEGWLEDPLEVYDINTSTPGNLHMMPFTTSWYQDYRGPLLFKEITGNFIFSTKITATNRVGNSTPSSSFSLAGVMLRQARPITNGLADWTPGGENYIFLSAGTANPVNQAPHLEIKNTDESISNLQITPISTNEDVEIRFARIDQYVICLYRVPDQDWSIRGRYVRPDFPDSMQIGFVTYTDWPKLSSFTETYANSHLINNTADPDSSNNPGLPYNPDLIGRFEYARFDSIVVPPDLVGSNLANAAAVPDSTLLLFLGQPSQPFIAQNIRYEVDTTGISILSDMENDYINIVGDLRNYTISITDTMGQQIESYTGLYHKLTIDISELPLGPHFLIIVHNHQAVIRTQRFVKED